MVICSYVYMLHLMWREQLCKTSFSRPKLRLSTNRPSHSSGSTICFIQINFPPKQDLLFTNYAAEGLLPLFLMKTANSREQTFLQSKENPSAAWLSRFLPRVAKLYPILTSGLFKYSSGRLWCTTNWSQSIPDNAQKSALEVINAQSHMTSSSWIVDCREQIETCSAFHRQNIQYPINHIFLLIHLTLFPAPHGQMLRLLPDIFIKSIIYHLLSKKKMYLEFLCFQR